MSKNNNKVITVSFIIDIVLTIIASFIIAIYELFLIFEKDSISITIILLLYTIALIIIEVKVISSFIKEHKIIKKHQKIIRLFIKKVQVTALYTIITIIVISLGGGFLSGYIESTYSILTVIVTIFQLIIPIVLINIMKQILKKLIIEDIRNKRKVSK